MMDFPLSALSGLRIEPIIAYRAQVPEWGRDVDVANSYYTFWFVEKGEVRLDWTGGGCRLGPGRAVLIPPGLRRQHRIHPETRLISISFWAGWDDARVVIPFDEPLTAARSEIAGVLWKAEDVCRLVSAGSGPDDSLREKRFGLSDWIAFRAGLELFVAEIVSWLNRCGTEQSVPGSGDLRLGRVLADLRANLQAGPLPYARWREQTGLSKVQLDRLARRWLGGSLRRRRDEMLFQEIRRSLANGPDSLKELSARLGFCDAAHFSRWVKQRTRQNPRSLRGAWV